MTLPPIGTIYGEMWRCGAWCECTQPKILRVSAHCGTDSWMVTPLWEGDWENGPDEERLAELWMALRQKAAEYGCEVKYWEKNEEGMSGDADDKRVR